MVCRNQHTVLDAADGCVADVALGCVPALRPRFFTNSRSAAPLQTGPSVLQSPLMRARQLVHALAFAQGALRPGRAPVLALRPELQPGEGTAHRGRWAHGGCSYQSLVEAITPCDLQPQLSAGDLVLIWFFPVHARTVRRFEGSRTAWIQNRAWYKSIPEEERAMVAGAWLVLEDPSLVQFKLYEGTGWNPPSP